MRKMVETNMMEEIEVNGDHLFDQIDDLLEFPTDVVDSEVFGSVAVDSAGFPTAWSSGDLPEYSACCSRSTTSDISTELFVSYEDIVQLDWLSTFVEDSFSGGGSSLKPEKNQVTCAENINAFQNRFQTSSPVSVLESSSNNTFSSGGRTVPVSHEKRARSKRPRPATFSPRSPIPLIAPGLPAPVTSHPVKKIKILPPTCSGALHLTPQIPKQEQVQEQEQNLNAVTIRKCKHCGITKTPQWRSGPMGPKSLCNACGVRFKSGRLYPEYRPAASPTFVPSLHSNSHKKVLEMRGCN